MIEAIHRAKFGDTSGSGKKPPVKPVVEVKAAQATGKPKFDRVAYQREYMRKSRAAKKKA